MKNAIKMFEQRTVQLKPGASCTVGLGTYPSARLMTDFDISSVPDLGESLGTSLEMINIPGSERVMGMCHLHNFSPVPCEVTVSNRNISEAR
jgi:hypothetical protein